MDAIELIKQRISTNKFDTSRTLSETEIKELVSYATEAPSAYNIQNWRFVAVTSPEEKARLKSLAYNQQKVVDAAVTFIVLGDLRGYEKLPQILKPLIDDGVMDKATADGWTRSASFAAMTLMIAAQAKGLASGPMIGFDPAGVKREFNISDRYVPVMLLTVGY